MRVGSAFYLFNLICLVKINDIGMVICLENIKNNDIGNLISLLGMVIYSNY